jgi:hypothetical protein
MKIGSRVKQGSNRGHDREGVKGSPPICLNRGDPNDGNTDTEVYVLTLKAIKSWHTPAIVRLRAALKCLLRGWGLRCTSIKPEQPKAEP